MENLGPGAADMVVAFSSGDVEDFGLRASIGAMATEVMANTCASSTADVRGVARSSERIVMDRATEPGEITDAARVAGPLRFDVEATSPPIVNEYGRRSRLTRCSHSGSAATGCGSPTGNRRPPRGARPQRQGGDDGPIAGR